MKTRRLVTTYRNNSGPSRGDILDYIGVGFGPSNLSLAVAAREHNVPLTGHFFESKERFEWHPGMMINGAKLQISFLKDLVTLRNPQSKYTFLQYLKTKGRLERFVNLREMCPSRVEYEDYLRWVAADFEDVVTYGARVSCIDIVPTSTEDEARVFRVHVEASSGHSSQAYLAQNIVYGAGGRPNLSGLPPSASSVIMHSADFMHRFSPRFRNCHGGYSFAVAGGGQSAGEIVRYLLDRYPKCSVTLILPQHVLRQVDDNPFMNESFFSTETDQFFKLNESARRRILCENACTNYGVIDADLSWSLYHSSYQDEVSGVQRLFIEKDSRVLSAIEKDGRAEVEINNDLTGRQSGVHCDAIVFATGYTRDLEQSVFKELLPHLERDDGGSVIVSRWYKAKLRVPAKGDLFLQGMCEDSHGIGDTLLSWLPFRSQEIVEGIVSNVQQLSDRRG